MSVKRSNNDPAFWTPRDNARFWSKVQTSDDCWLWTGSLDKDGYGRMKCGIRNVGAHRFAYELLIGPIPEGKVLDHIECDNPRCVNPGHMQPTTNTGNILRGRSFSAVNSRKTHCLRGHALTPENIFISRGKRECRQCNTDRTRAKYWRDKMKADNRESGEAASGKESQ